MLSTEDEKVVQISCGIDFAPELQAYIESSAVDQFAIIFDSDGINIANITGETALIKEQFHGDGYSLETQTICGDSINFSSISAKTIVPTKAVPYAVQHKSLSVPYVENVSYPECGEIGLCWAASTAMVVNYFRGSTHTANSIHVISG